MKVIEFVKKNISVFSFFGFCLIIILIKLIFQETNEENLSGIQLDEILFLKIKFIFFILILLFLDYFLKILIKNRLIINLLELIIIISVYIFYYYK